MVSGRPTRCRPVTHLVVPETRSPCHAPASHNDSNPSVVSDEQQQEEDTRRHTQLKTHSNMPGAAALFEAQE